MKTLFPKLFDLLPSYFKRNDSYPISNKGFLERYLEIYQEEIDQNIIPYIANSIDQLDPNTASGKFLSEIAYALGTPLDIFDGTDEYRKLLLFAIAIYKIKGTLKSYELLFGLLGLQVSILESGGGAVGYDIPIQYDDGAQYDLSFKAESGCYDCTPYTLLLFGSNQPDEDLLYDMVTFVEPINADLVQIILTTFPVAYFYVDSNGDLIFNNNGDDLDAGVVDGDLVLDGPNAGNYILNPAGDIYITI